MILIDDGSRASIAYGIWQRNFHDPVLYADFYYEEVYGKNKVYFNVGEDGEEYKGMLHLNPYTMVVRGKEIPAHYIVGVSTEEDYRRQGVMRELLRASLGDMKKAGEPFTYLMPADTAYYLPFDFRFGMTQIEQEVHYQREAAYAIPEDYTIFEWKDYMALIAGQNEGKSPSYPSLEEIALLECQAKRDTFAIYTKITPEYLERLEKEVGSEYGKTVFVFKEGNYYGRFCAVEEYSYLILCRFFCGGDAKEKQAFVHMALEYCAKEFGDYGDYHLIFDESWKPAILPYGGIGASRILPAKYVDKIMFRILNLDRIAPHICMENWEKEKTYYLKVTDPFLGENTGIYQWKVDEENVEIRKLAKEEADKMEKLDGEIGISRLTEILFGSCDMEELQEAAVSEEVKEMFKHLQPLRDTCIMEIV